MKTITQTINLFKFEELIEEVQQKVIEKNRYINTDFDWHESIFESFKEDNEKYFDIKNIYFTGFWSQGDGAMFEYSGINENLLNEAIESLNLPKWKKQILSTQICINGKGVQRGHYYHENSCDHTIYIEDNNNGYYQNIYDLIDLYSSDIEDFIITKYKDICQDLYKNLENENDYLQSDEVIKETLICNDYDFTEEGDIY